MDKVRARIGYISPAAVRNPSDWNDILPPGVILVAVTLNVKAHTREEFEKALGKLEDAALTLKGEGAEVVVMSGTPLATLNGKRAESELLAKLEAITEVPTISMMSASVEAMRHLSMKKIAVATPFREELNARITSYLEESGFTVAAFRGCEIKRPIEADLLPPDTCYRVAKEAFESEPGLDGVFVDGRWPMVDYIERLEAEIQKPVVTNHQAALWWALRTMKIDTPIRNLGRLFRGS